MLIQWILYTDHHNELIAVEGALQAKTSNWMMEEEHQKKPTICYSSVDVCYNAGIL